MPFISRINNSKGAPSDKGSFRAAVDSKTETTAQEIKAILMQAKSHKNTISKILYYFKTVLKTVAVIPLLIDLVRRDEEGGGSSSSCFRNHSIEGNLKELAENFSQLPENYADFMKLYKFGGQYGQLMFKTTEVSVYLQPYGDIVSYENDIFGEVKKSTKQTLFEYIPLEEDEDSKLRYSKFREINVSLYNYLTDKIEVTIYPACGAGSRITTKEGLLAAIKNDIQASTGLLLKNDIGVILAEDGKSIDYIGPVKGNQAQEVIDVAIFNFNGTQENGSSPSIHNEFIKKANIPDAHKCTFNGPAGSDECGGADILAGTLVGQNKVDGVDQNIAAALEKADVLYKAGVKKFFIEGWSRGGITAIIFANMLKAKYPDVEITAFIIDPVLGGFESIANFQSEYKKYLDQNNKGITWVYRYAEHETSVGFNPYILWGLNDLYSNSIVISPNSRVIPSTNHHTIAGLSVTQERNFGKFGRPDKFKAEEFSKVHYIVSTELMEYALATMGIGFKNPMFIPHEQKAILSDQHKHNDNIQKNIKIPATYPMPGIESFSTRDENLNNLKKI